MRRPARERSLNVGFGGANVMLALAADVAGSADAEAEVRVVCPVDLIVPATIAGAGEVGNLVMFEACRLQHVYRRCVHRQLALFVELSHLTKLLLPPKRCSFFVGQAVSRDMCRLKSQCAAQIAFPLRDGLARHTENQVK